MDYVCSHSIIQCMTTVQHLKTCMTDGWDGWMTLLLTADPCQKFLRMVK